MSVIKEFTHTVTDIGNNSCELNPLVVAVEKTDRIGSNYQLPRYHTISFYSLFHQQSLSLRRAVTFGSFAFWFVSVMWRVLTNSLHCGSQVCAHLIFYIIELAFSIYLFNIFCSSIIIYYI